MNGKLSYTDNSLRRFKKKTKRLLSSLFKGIPRSTSTKIFIGLRIGKALAKKRGEVYEGRSS